MAKRVRMLSAPLTAIFTSCERRGRGEGVRGGRVGPPLGLGKSRERARQRTRIAAGGPAPSRVDSDFQVVGCVERARGVVGLERAGQLRPWHSAGLPTERRRAGAG
jgi:hypothetical protein